MELTNPEKLILKAEMTNNTLGFGLTILPEDDEANAVKLNEVRESIQEYRASVPSDDILIPVDEWNALSAGQQSWWTNQTNDGSVRPSVIAAEFALMFGANTRARVNFEAATREPASIVRKLLGRHYTVTTSEVSSIRDAT